jgi:uncharacterized membrane protein
MADSPFFLYLGSMEHSSGSSSEALYRAGHRIFLLGLALKAVNALFELIVGGLLLVLPLETIRVWTQAAVDGVRSLLHGAWDAHLASALDSVTMETVVFVAWYFVSHGVLKAFVIACLLARKLWAYPLGIVVFVGFGIYQTWEYFHGGAVFYLVLDVLDAALIGLTILEWKHALRTEPPSVDNGSASLHP